MPKWGCEGLLIKISWNGVTKVMVRFFYIAPRFFNNFSDKFMMNNICHIGL